MISLTEQDYQCIGARLREVRTQRNCSVQELADQIDLHKNTLSSIERGKQHPSLETLVLLVQALDVSLDYIVLGRRPQAGNWGLILHSDDEADSSVQTDAVQRA